MATPAIDLGLMKVFMPFFTVLLLFTILYAFFQWSKLFGDNKLIHSAIALLIAFFVGIFSDGARVMFEFMVPWFSVLIIFLIFAILVFKIFGASDSDLRMVIGKHSGLRWTIIVVLIIIGLGALSSAFGQRMLSITTDTPDDGQPAQTDGSSQYDYTDRADDPDGAFEQDRVLGPNQAGSKSTATADLSQNIGATFFHPKVVGTLFLLIVAAVAIKVLTSPMTPEWP